MASLAGRSIKDTFKNVIQVDNSNSGVDSSLRQVTDGGANATPVYVSNNKAKIQPGENSTTAFEIQNADGDSLITVDSTNDTVDIPVLTADTVNGVIISKGNTASRPTLGATDVCIYYDTTLKLFIFWNGTDWV